MDVTHRNCAVDFFLLILLICKVVVVFECAMYFDFPVSIE